MPIYEYQCEKCEFILEKIQKISDEPEIKCPQCSTDSLKKLISVAGFRLKGGGWYESDFKTSNHKNLHEKPKSDKPSPPPACGGGSCPART